MNPKNVFYIFYFNIGWKSKVRLTVTHQNIAECLKGLETLILEITGEKIVIKNDKLK